MKNRVNAAVGNAERAREGKGQKNLKLPGATRSVLLRATLDNISSEDAIGEKADFNLRAKTGKRQPHHSYNVGKGDSSVHRYCVSLCVYGSRGAIRLGRGSTKAFISHLSRRAAPCCCCGFGSFGKGH